MSGSRKSSVDMITVKNRLMFNGIPMRDMNVRTSRSHIDITSVEDDYRVFMKGLDETELDCCIVLQDPHLPQTMLDWLSSCDNEFVNLGPGRICEYCGEYKVAGELQCHRCGGATILEKFARVNSFPFILADYSVGHNVCDGWWNEVTVIDMHFVSRGEVHNETLYGLMSSVNLETIPHTLTLDSSKYLCEWCGMVVDGDGSCPGCAGTRLPWSEMVKLDRACLYCGTGVTGGIVCRACGARLSGLSYSMVNGSYFQ